LGSSKELKVKFTQKEYSTLEEVFISAVQKQQESVSPFEF
jgi:hypothetical protein